MRHFLAILAALIFCYSPAQAQTVKALSYGTNGHFITGTNVLTFTNSIRLAQGDLQITESGMLKWSGADRMELETYTLYGPWNFDQPVAVRSNLGFLTNLNTLWTATNASNARSAVGLGATWLTNTNVTNFRTAIGLGQANNVQFTDVTAVNLLGAGNTNVVIDLDDSWLMNNGSIILEWQTSAITAYRPIDFANTTNAATTRTNLGLGATWLTNTNVTNFRAAIGLSSTNDVAFKSLATDAFFTYSNYVEVYGPIFIGDSGTNDIFQFESGLPDQAKARTNLGLGAANIVTFSGITNNGDIRINQTTPTNGLLFVYRTNNEPFLGLANLIASNNTTVSNETLFRVGVAEATNRAAQFGFRATNTNGNGVAVFSVFGFNGLMQIGADASTNAVIYSGGGTNNEVMTLIRDGATEFARPLRFSTNASTRPATNAPANTTNVAAWVEMRIGTNSYRVQLFQ